MRKFVSSFVSTAALVVGLAGASLWSGDAHAKFVFPYNHPDLDWYSIETEHFEIHFPTSRKQEGNDHYLTAEWTAKKTAKIAEEMWPRMCGEFNYFLKEKIHIVLLNQGDDLEGFTIPNWDWIEISANPGVNFYRQRGRMDWLPDVLVHEFAHVVSLKANGVFSEGTQGISIGGLYSDGVHDTENGAEITILDNDPFYWTEGGAEYWSDNAGYNWWTPSRDMHIRTTVLEDRLLTYDEWQTRAQQFRWGDGERGYQQGYSFALYLRQRFGNDTYNKFALEGGKGWRPDWNQVVENVTGIPARTLYDDWVAYITQKYAQQYDAVKAQGEVAGAELLDHAVDWDFKDPDARDAFYDPRWKIKKGITGKDLARIEREKAKEATGSWQMVPQYSDDGKWYGVNNRGAVVLKQVPERHFSVFGGEHPSDGGIATRAAYSEASVPAGFMSSWDFVPGKDAIVVVESEHNDYTPRTPLGALTGIRLETDGYNWNQLWYFDIPQGEEKDGNVSFKGHKRDKLLGRELEFSPKEWKKFARVIPNTLRGIEPSVSPDGSKVAYFEYTDGTLNLVTINLDGSQKKHLTEFDDGTWMQHVDWSPDGSELAVVIFRNFQQDIYLMKADGTDVRPLMYDRWEDADPHWAKDGKIYFSSDHSGIFNIYSYDVAQKRILQVTNVIGGAETPSITPEGNLLYSAYTAHGWKVYGVPKEDFLNRDVTAAFDVDSQPAAVKSSWDFREDLSAFVPKKYEGDLMAPTGAPQFRVTNDSLDNVSFQAGGYLFMQDFVENHGLYLSVLLGEDTQLVGQYFFQGWYPTITLTGVHYEVKYNYGFLLDEDNNAATNQDQSRYEGRNQQYQNVAFLSVDYPWNPAFSTSLSARYLDFGFRTVTESDFVPYSFNVQGALALNYNSFGGYSTAANLSGGRNVDLTFAHGFTDIVYQAQGGRSVDDGQLLDAYGYNAFEGRWTEQIPVPAWGDFLSALNKKRHTIQVDLGVGYVDRNVDRNDEFRGGGQHPFYYGSDSLRPNTLFAGYPSSSLSGETMLQANLAYRFPIRRELNRKIGPLYVYDVTGQVMGTAGNLWSFRGPTKEGTYYNDGYGERVATKESSIRREIPFVDQAYKNGNYLLYDAGAELRVTSTLFNSAYWNSFVRVVYGFNEVKGYGDVNGDDIQDTTDSATNDALSNETELPGVRVYVGLGTGW